MKTYIFYFENDFDKIGEFIIKDFNNMKLPKIEINRNPKQKLKFFIALTKFLKV